VKRRDRRCRRKHEGERGVALIVVLWGLALVAVAVIAIGLAGRSQTLLARNAVENARARLAAEAGVQLGLRRLLAAASQGGGAGGGAVRGFDGTPETWRSGDGADVGVAIRDEGGKIDLNEAPPELIAGLAAVAGARPEGAQQIACAIVERRGYLPAGCVPSGVTPGLFAALEELRFVPGVTDALYARMAPAATVHSGAATIDPRVAGREALLAVPTLAPDIVDSIVARRETRRDAGWRDDPLTGGGGSETDMLRDRRYFAVSAAQIFAIAASARSTGGGHAKAEAIVRLTDDAKRPYLVLAWRAPPG
jgi:general secretion pathway protein K